MAILIVDPMAVVSEQGQDIVLNRTEQVAIEYIIVPITTSFHPIRLRGAMVARQIPVPPEAS